MKSCYEVDFGSVGMGEEGRESLEEGEVGRGRPEDVGEEDEVVGRGGGRAVEVKVRYG